MKKIWLMGMLFLLTTNVFAGTSVNDPMIRQLRARFEAAHAPTMSELNIGKTWNCTFFGASAMDFRSFPNALYTFVNFDGIIQRQEGVSSPDDKNNSSKYFSFHPEGLVSAFSQTPDLVGYMIFRIDSEGHLLAENLRSWLSEQGRTQIDQWQMEDSISSPPIKAAFYGTCVQK